MASLSTVSNPMTTIIINNLNKDDFVNGDKSSENKSYLCLADQIKLLVLNLRPSSFNLGTTIEDEDNYFLNQIEYWTNLPFLNRIIIILKTELAAKVVYEYLSAGDNPFLVKYPYIKVTLQENLLSRSKSFDNLINPLDNLDVSKSLAKFREQYSSNSIDYNEPVPHRFDALQDLHKLGIDLRDYNDEALLEPQPETPVALGRSRSLTKTLFKPELKLNTNLPKAKDSPQSPTITLDETF